MGVLGEEREEGSYAEASLVYGELVERGGIKMHYARCWRLVC